MLDLGGTGYLGLQNDPQWLGLVQKYLQKFGTNHPISRLNQHADFEILHQVEAYLARHLGCEAACLFSSGFLAGLAVARFTAEKAFEFQSGLWLPDNHHPCLAPPVGWKPSSHPVEPDTTPGIPHWIAFAQTIDPIFGDPDPSINHPSYLHAPMRVLDVSHSLGLWDHQSMIHDQTLVTGSLGKAWAFPAGFVAGSKETIAAIQTSGTFCASAPPSIAFACAFLEFSETRLALRRQLADLLEEISRYWGVPHSHQQLCPIYNFGQHSPSLRPELEQQGFFLSWLQYPTPTAPLFMRAVFKANQNPDQVRNFLQWLRKRSISPQKQTQPFHSQLILAPAC